MFIKLNKTFADLKFVEGEEAVSYGGIISYLKVKDVDKDLLKVIPEKYRNLFSTTIMKINNSVPPHTDSKAKTVINFYVKSGNYKTLFFDGKSKSYQVKNQTNGMVFDRNGLMEKGSFVAKDGDIFCLDVDKIHAVDCLDKDPTERIAVCISTGDFNFEQVCNMLSETKYIG